MNNRRQLQHWHIVKIYLYEGSKDKNSHSLVDNKKLWNPWEFVCSSVPSNMVGYQKIQAYSPLIYVMTREFSLILP